MWENIAEDGKERVIELYSLQDYMKREFLISYNSKKKLESNLKVTTILVSEPSLFYVLQTAFKLSDSMDNKDNKLMIALG